MVWPRAFPSAIHLLTGLGRISDTTSLAPLTIRVQQLEWAEVGLVPHRTAGLDPVPQVVIRDARLPRERDFLKRAERPQPPTAFVGVEVEVHAAQRPL